MAIKYGWSVMSIVIDGFAVFLDALLTVVYLGMPILSPGDIWQYLEAGKGVVTAEKWVLLASYGAEARESAKYPIMNRKTPYPSSRALTTQNSSAKLEKSFFFNLPKSITT